MSDRKAAGLFIQGTDTRVPLTGVRIRVEGCGAAARVTVAQRYVNTEKKPIEAVYSFPLEESSAVCGFTVETGGRVIVGKVEEKEKAFEKYDDAMADGHGAFLVDQDRPNIFTASVGNLKPGQEATITLAYASELEQHGDSVRVMIPTTIAPRYIPQSDFVKMDPAELDHINPPTIAGPVPYGLSFELSYQAPQGVKSVNCPSHPAQVEMDGSTARVSLMGDNVQLDRDVVVNITLARPHEAGAIVSRDSDGVRAVMLNFYPDLVKGARKPSEFIFVVDRSGSMMGESIEQALNALRLALRSMDEGDVFNIVGFGSRIEMMFREPVAYSQKTLDDATQRLENWNTDLGGTELLEPLKLVLKHSDRAELPRQVMLLTDGEVGNEAECIALAGKHPGTRIFTFGIGSGASEYLVRGLARASGGQAEFIQPNERIEPKVMRQFARAASPYLKNVRVDWGTLQTDLAAPEVLPPLFNGDRLTLYGRVIGGSAGEVAILADGPDGAIRVPMKVDLERVIDAPAVPVLMARRAIQGLEENQTADRGSNQSNRKAKNKEARILELALRYQLMSSQTSFIAIEERTAAEQTTERAELRRVPVALTKGWGDKSEERERGISIKGLAMSKSLRAFGGAASVARRSAAVPGGAPCPPPMAAPAPAKMRKKSGMFGALREMLGGGGTPPQEPKPAASRSQDMDDLSLSVSSDMLMDTEGCAEVKAPDDIENLVSEPAEELLRLAGMQKADGHFAFDEVDAGHFGLAAACWKKFELDMGNWTSTIRPVASTLAALVLLETRFASRRDEWQMIADKAERWLAKQKVTLPAGEVSLKDWARKSLGL